MKKSVILIKLGGSVITEKDKLFSLRKEVLSRLIGEIKRAKKLGIPVFYDIDDLLESGI